MEKRDEVDEALASGADGHLTRSLRAEELRQKVQSLKQSTNSRFAICKQPPCMVFYILTLRAYKERLPAEEKVARSNRVEGARLADSRWCAPVPQWDRGAVYETEG